MRHLIYRLIQKRNDNEIITGDWEFQTSIDFNNRNNNPSNFTTIGGSGNIILTNTDNQAFVDFKSNSDPGFDIRLQQSPITFSGAKGVTYTRDGLRVVGGGFKVEGAPVDGIQGDSVLSPLGLELRRGDGKPHIDFLTSAGQDYDTRIQQGLIQQTIGGGNFRVVKALKVLSPGGLIVEEDDSDQAVGDPNSDGRTSVGPRGIYLERPQGQSPTIWFGNNLNNQQNYLARINVTSGGAMNIATKQGLYVDGVRVNGSGGGGGVAGVSSIATDNTINSNNSIGNVDLSVNTNFIATRSYVDNAIVGGGGNNGDGGIWDVTKPINGIVYSKAQLRQALQAIETVTNGSYNTIVIPRGQYTHDQPTTYSKFKGGTIVGEAGQTWVTLAGDGTLGQSHINLSNNKNVVKSIQFRFMNVNDSRKRLKFLSMGSRSNWDTDGIIIDCVFTAAKNPDTNKSAAGWKQTNAEWDAEPIAAVHYIGRNLKMHECSFTVEGTCVIVESAASNSEEPYKNTPQGFRKFEFTDNRIHSCERFLAVQGNAHFTWCNYR